MFCKRGNCVEMRMLLQNKDTTENRKRALVVSWSIGFTSSSILFYFCVVYIELTYVGTILYTKK